MLELSDKGYKIIMSNMLKEIKEGQKNMRKEEEMLWNDIIELKKNQIELLEVKNLNLVMFQSF